MSLKDKIKIFSKSISQLFVGLYFVGILNANQDYYISFQYASRYYDLLPDIMNSILEQPTSLVLKTTNESWNSHYLDPYKKIKAIKNLYEIGLNKGTFIHSIRYRYENYSKNNGYNDLAIPLVMDIESYKIQHLDNNYYYAFRSKLVKTISKSRDMNSSGGRAITLVSKEIAGEEVSLKIVKILIKVFLMLKLKRVI